MLEPETENEKPFVNYFAKMLAKYGGVTEEEFDEISKQRRQAKIGKKERD
jgi:hypothetical protein